MLLLINLIVCLLLTGLIWTIQLVHYPLFLKIEEASFIQYLNAHQKQITPLVAPLMIIELLCSIWLFFHLFKTHLIIAIIQVFLVLIIWLSTFLVQVPLHQKLIKAYNKKACQKLIDSNWLRTICWSLRAAVLLIYH